MRKRRQRKRKRGGERVRKGEEEGERVRGKRRSGPVWGLGPGVTVGCRPPRGKHLNISLLLLPRLSRKLCEQTNYIRNYVTPSYWQFLGNFSYPPKMLVLDTFLWVDLTLLVMSDLVGKVLRCGGISWTWPHVLLPCHPCSWWQQSHLLTLEPFGIANG